MSKFEQWGGLAALLSGILAIFYLPFDASSFFAKKGEAEFSGIIPWSDTFQDLAGPLLTFGTPEEVHVTYEVLGFLVMLGFAVGLVALHRRQGELAGKLGRWGFYVSLARSMGESLSKAGCVPKQRLYFRSNWHRVLDPVPCYC